jgi:ATP-binding cassette subfamily B protein RaxB
MSTLNNLLEFSGRRRTPYVQQNEASECALACLTMVASHHGYQTDLSTLRQRHPLSLKGATLKQVISIAEAIGFNIRPVRGDLDELAHLTLPAILHWNLNHFVVLVRVNKGFRGTRYHIHDPAKGALVLTRQEISRHFTGVAVELVKSENFKPRIEREQLGITQLWSSMSGFWQVARSIVVLSLILQLAALAAPFYLQIAIDTVTPAADHDLLLMLAIGFGGLSVVSLVATWLRALILANLNSALSYQVVVNLFRHLVRLPLPWFEKRHVGDVISRFGSTLPITQLLSDGMIASFIDGLMAVLTLGLMFAYSPLLAGVAIVVLLLYIVLRVAFLHTMRLKNLDAITATARENSLFIESVRGIAAIKAFGQEGNRQRLWQRAKADAVNANIKLGRMTAGFDAFGSFIMGAERVIFVYLAVSLVLEAEMSIGMLFAFQAYKQQFLDTSMRLVGQAVSFNLIKVHLGRLSDIALTKTEDDGRSVSHDHPDFSGGIEVKGVRFRYGVGETEVLKGVNLRIEPGEMVALVGPSGGGKTTLLKIMMGLYEPSFGQILVGDRPLSNFPKRSFRGRVGLVAQDDALYAGSLADNISFFDPEINMERVHEVARIASIDEDIRKMPLVYDTLVGDMGSTLSGGQKQRVLLARALYNRPDILFMDEGTANLDPASEQRIISSLLSLRITRVLIAHRPALIHASDRVFLCAEGAVHPLRKDIPAHEEQTTG